MNSQVTEFCQRARNLRLRALYERASGLTRSPRRLQAQARCYEAQVRCLADLAISQRRAGVQS
jgi:hypothetical protein